jgi:Bacterial transferase hexapeptide (six repeats)
MKTVIIATNNHTESVESNSGKLTPLFPFLNRPFIEHVVGDLVTQGIKDIHVIVGDDCGSIEGTLGSGERWGCVIRYHWISEQCSPFAHIEQTFGSQSEPLLLVHAGRLVDVNIAQFGSLSNKFRPLLFVEHASDSTDTAASKWTGWAVLPPNSISKCASWATELGSENLIRESQDRDTWLIVPPPLAITSQADLLKSQGVALREKASDLLSFEREIQEGVWAGRNAAIHPQARIIGPALVGDNSRIGKGVVLGPNVVIGANCFVDHNTTVSNSLILHNTYVGPRLEVRDSVIDQNELTNVRLGTSVSIDDHLLLGSFPQGRILG